MELYNNNKKYPSFGKYPGKLNKFSLFSNENHKFTDNLKSTKNILRSSISYLKEFCNKSDNKNSNMVGLPLADYELINLKRKEAPHVIPTRYKYIDENRKRLLNKKLYSPDNNTYSKLKNAYYSIFHQSGINFAKNLKIRDNNYMTIQSEDQIYNDNSIKKRIITSYSNKNKISEKLIKFNNRKRNNEIFLPTDYEHKYKNYMQVNDDGNFMEKYQYYLLNLNKNKNNSLNKQMSNVENKNINNYNKQKNKNYFKSYNNIFNNNFHQIKPYKYNQYYFNSEKNNFQKESLTDRVSNTTKNNKNLSKYLDDSYIKQFKKISNDNNSNKNNRSKTIDSTRKENNLLSINYLEKPINQLNRRVLCINEKNEDLVLRKAINLLEKENEKLTDEVDKNMNIFCKIKNFSLTQGNEYLIPLINEIILSKILQKKIGTKEEGKTMVSDDKNKDKNYILNKELKVFDLEKNQKFNEEEEEARENKLENMYLNFIKKKNNKKGKNAKIEKFEKTDNVLDNITQILFKSEKKLKKNNSFDNKDNLEENKLFNYPSLNNTNKKTKLFKNPSKNKNNKENTKNDKQKLPFKFQLNFTSNENSLAKLTKTKKIDLQNNTERIIKNNFRIIENNNDNVNKTNSNNNDLNKDIENIENMKSENILNNYEENIKFDENDKESLDNQKTNKEPTHHETIKNIIFNDKKEKEKEKINYLKIHELLIKENRENITKNYISQTKFFRRNNIKTKSIYYKLKPNLDKISYTINNFNTDKNNDEGELIELNEIKKQKFERKKKSNMMTTMFRNLPKNTIKKKKKSPRKKLKNKTRNKNDNINDNYNDQSKDEMNNYIKFMNALKKEEESKLAKRENNNILFSNKSPRKSIKKGSRLSLVDKISKNSKKAYSKQKTFKDLKGESCDESKSIDSKEYLEAKKKLKPKSNLNQFKDELNKMKNMSVNDYVKYMENYFSLKDQYDTNIIGQERINKFLEGMRKNIERFKGKQNILTINCQPIDYFLTIGNGLGNYFIDKKENKQK